MKIRRPCANCPWRVDAPREHWDPQHFIDIARNCRDDGLNVMGCHKSTKTKFRPCQGWARVMGFEAIGVRIACMNGTLKLEEIEDHDGPELFTSFDAMLKANKIKIPPRNRAIDIVDVIKARRR